MQSLIQALLRFNESLFLTINAQANHSSTADQLMPLVANDALFLFPLFLLLLWFAPRGQTSAASAERSLSREAVLWSVFAVIIALVINVALGAVINEPRPFVTQPQNVDLLTTHSADASFPSDHASISFAIAGCLLIRYVLALRTRITPKLPGPDTAPASSPTQPFLSRAERSRLRWITGLLAALGLFVGLAIGYARVYVGVHYPLDILGGALIGLFSAWVVSLARKLLKPVAQLVERGARLVHLA